MSTWQYEGCDLCLQLFLHILPFSNMKNSWTFDQHHLGKAWNVFFGNMFTKKQQKMVLLMGTLNYLWIIFHWWCFYKLATSASDNEETRAGATNPSCSRHTEVFSDITYHIPYITEVCSDQSASLVILAMHIMLVTKYQNVVVIISLLFQ